MEINKSENSWKNVECGTVMWSGRNVHRHEQLPCGIVSQPTFAPGTSRTHGLNGARRDVPFLQEAKSFEHGATQLHTPSAITTSVPKRKVTYRSGISETKIYFHQRGLQHKATHVHVGMRTAQGQTSILCGMHGTFKNLHTNSCPRSTQGR